MKNINMILESVGLSPREQRVYMSMRGNGKLSSAEVLKLTQLPRPTVLAALRDLRNIGLIATTRQDGRSLTYKALPIGSLKTHLGGQIRELEQTINELDYVSDEQEGSVLTQTGHGQKHAQDLLEQALRCRTRQWNIIAPRDNALRYLSPEYVTYFKRVRKTRQITSQTLWEAKSQKTTISLVDTLMRKPRFVPKEVSSSIPSLLLSFDDSLLAITGTKQPEAVLITNPQIVQTFNILFELAWRSAKKSTN